MRIEVFNPNNPGAKFTSNTENTLVVYYHELKKQKDLEKQEERQKKREEAERAAKAKSRSK